MLYEQRKSVRGVQNPPPGEFSVRNNRAEGYADHKPDMYYMSATKLTTVSHAQALTASVVEEKAKLVTIRNSNKCRFGDGCRNRYRWRKSVKPLENVFADATEKSTSWSPIITKRNISKRPELLH